MLVWFNADAGCSPQLDFVPAAVHDPAGGRGGLNLEHIVDATECQEPEGAQRDEIAPLRRSQSKGGKANGACDKTEFSSQEQGTNQTCY